MFHESRCKSFDRKRDFLIELTVENLRWIEIYDDLVCEEMDELQIGINRTSRGTKCNWKKQKQEPPEVVPLMKPLSLIKPRAVLVSIEQPSC